MNVFKQIATFVVCLSIFAACASVGKNFDSTQIDHIEKGKTRAGDLVSMFGEPNNRGQNASGIKTMMWVYSESRVKGETFIPICYCSGGDNHWWRRLRCDGNRSNFKRHRHGLYNRQSGGVGYTGTPTITIAPPPFLPKLTIATSRVGVTMQVVPGKRYQLESSNDLPNFGPVGAPFVADMPAKKKTPTDDSKKQLAEIKWLRAENERLSETYIVIQTNHSRLLQYDGLTNKQVKQIGANIEALIEYAFGGLTKAELGKTLKRVF